MTGADLARALKLPANAGQVRLSDWRREDADRPTVRVSRALAAKVARLGRLDLVDLLAVRPPTAEEIRQESAARADRDAKAKADAWWRGLQPGERRRYEASEDEATAALVRLARMKRWPAMPPAFASRRTKREDADWRQALRDGWITQLWQRALLEERFADDEARRGFVSWVVQHTNARQLALNLLAREPEPTHERGEALRDAGQLLEQAWQRLLEPWLNGTAQLAPAALESAEITAARITESGERWQALAARNQAIRGEAPAVLDRLMSALAVQDLAPGIYAAVREAAWHAHRIDVAVPEPAQGPWLRHEAPTGHMLSEEADSTRWSAWQLIASAADVGRLQVRAVVMRGPVLWSLAWAKDEDGKPEILTHVEGLGDRWLDVTLGARRPDGLLYARCRGDGRTEVRWWG